MVHVVEPLDYPAGTTLPQLLLELNVNSVATDHPAIIDGCSGRTIYTHGSFRSAVARVANYLLTNIGFSHGCVVAILASNTHNYPVLVHGILAAGGVVSAFNPQYQAQRADWKPDSRAKLDYSPDLYLLSSETSHGNTWKCFDLEQAICNSPDTPVVYDTQSSPSQSELAFICFSSGTTGPMKGVYLTHENIIANIFQHRQRLGEMFGPGNDTVAALVTPFFHISRAGGLCLSGIPIVAFPKFELNQLITAIPRDRITHINIVPPIALRLLQSADDNTDYSSVKCLINGTAPLKEVVSTELSRRMGCTITQWYGMTEASPSVISQREDEVTITGTVGRLLPGMSLKIVDAEGAECGLNKPGELLIQGPNLMRGYVESSSGKLEDAFSDGYFKTGDIGYIDDKGFIFLVGRSKELIKAKGNQVAPADLEAILLGHPKVRDAAVRGINFPEQETEYPAAYISVDDDAGDHPKLVAEMKIGATDTSAGDGDVDASCRRGGHLVLP
ncbi:hypothetical protein BJX70DRAFT_403913 [Aspergillus crustosus]